MNTQNQGSGFGTYQFWIFSCAGIVSMVPCSPANTPKPENPDRAPLEPLNLNPKP